MPGTFYKGDVSEVTMGHETGLYIEHNLPATWSTVRSNDFTTLTFAYSSGGSGTGAGFFGGSAVLRVPTGMLVGCRMSFHGSGNFAPYAYDGSNSRVYTIVDHANSGSVTTLKVVPAFGNTGVTVSSATNDVLFIHSTGLPTAIDGAAGTSVWTNHANANSAVETSNIDQFVGLASFMTLPDTKVELHQHHVVGLGRQPSILQPGRVHHTGGAIEMPLHSPKWLYYCLGREVVDLDTMDNGYSKTGTWLSGTSVQPGQTYIDVNTLTFGGDHTFAVGDYIGIKDTTRVPTVYHEAVDEGTTDFWPGASSASSLVSDSYHFEATETHEIRRVVAISNTPSGSNTRRLFVDDPWSFAHTTSDTLYAFRFAADNSTGSPNVNSDKTITNPGRRLIFSGDTIPSFCIEHSIRNRDVGSYSQEGTGTAPGGATDSKQLTRVFRGCKISEWEISSTADAELKFRAIFDALSCYTDTGRFESANAGDRYTAHRMFQNTADSTVNRKVAGIADGSEKPFMFYNGTIEMFNSQIANIAAFELRGKTGLELFHVIQGNPIADSVDSNSRTLKQVPYGGTRNAAIAREGREEFEMDMDVYIGDPMLWQELRTHRNIKGTTGATGSVINMYFTKPTTGSTGSTPDLRILIDDYVITEAPIPVPDDKGLLRSKIKLRMKNIKIVSTDTLLHC